jgi:hypothetical protein
VILVSKFERLKRALNLEFLNILFSSCIKWYCPYVVVARPLIGWEYRQGNSAIVRPPCVISWKKIQDVLRDFMKEDGKKLKYLIN